MSSRVVLCRPKSGPAVNGTGDLIVDWSGWESIRALLVNVGYADLFCFVTVLSAVVSTRREPVGGRVLKNEAEEDETSTGVASALR